MKFSIVIPCYNDFRFLEETINSCLNQTYKNFEIILVDDGSSSDIEPYIEKFKNQIKLIKKQNGGQGSARNLGIRNSSGQWIVPLDSDDTIPENFLEIAMKNIVSENDIIVSSQIHINANGALTGGSFTSMITYVPGYMNLGIISTNIVGSNTSVFSRKIFDSINGYEEHDRKIFEDWDLWTKAFFAGANFKGDANLKYFYRLHDKNEWVGNQDSPEMLARVEYHKKSVIEKYGILGEKFKNNLKSKINYDTNHMKIFIVNLKRSIDRKNFMIEQFDRLGITNYEFFEAVDGVNNDYILCWC
jgi:glycosyltransferase involved in cell wall biosynthesis